MSHFELVAGCAQSSDARALEALLDAGVSELYLGYSPQSWRQRFGLEWSPNRRYRAHEQFLDAHSLRAAISQIHARGATTALTLNEHYTPPSAEKMLLSLAEEALCCGVDSFIVADLGLVERLKARFPEIPISLSNEAGVVNAEIARMAAQRGASRIIFSRELSLAEMATIVDGCADLGLQYEAFIAREYCVNASSYCLVSHGYGHLAHFCHDVHARHLVSLGNGEVRTLEQRPSGWVETPAFYRAISTFHRCGLCALETLKDLGVRFLKVPGRSSSALAAIQAIRGLLDGDDLSQERCRALIKSEDFCSGSYCYYDLHDLGQVGERCAKAEPTESKTSPSLEPKRRRLRSGKDSAEKAKTPLTLSLGWQHSNKLQPGSLKDGVGQWWEEGVDQWWEEGVGQAVGAEARRLLSEFGLDGPPSAFELDLSGCSLKLPSPKALAERISCLGDTPWGLSIPPAYGGELLQLERLVEGVVTWASPNTTLTVQDLGAARALRDRWPGVLVLGRMAMRLKRDVYEGDPKLKPVEIEGARMSDIEHAQRSAYGEPYWGNEAWRGILAEAGIDELELDLAPHALGALPDWPPIALRFPWAFLAMARACPTAIAVEGGSPAHATRRCSRACEDHLIIPEQRWRHAPILQRGKITSMGETRLEEELLAGVRRLVFAPFPSY